MSLSFISPITTTVDRPYSKEKGIKQIIQYVQAYITKHIATTFEFLHLEHPSFSELYLSTLIPTQFIIMNYNNEIMIQLNNKLQ